MPQADNVSKFKDAGLGLVAPYDGIDSGYIRTIENVWLDSYTIAFTTTKTTLDLAVIPAGRKLTSIEVQIETSISMTNGSLALGFSTDGAYGVIMEQSKVATNMTVSTLSMPANRGNASLYSTTLTGFLTKIGAFQKVITGTQDTISLQFNNWTMTTGTVKSIVRYT
jgi:hypothetical protein